MKSKLYYILYAIGVFLVFTLLTWALKYFGGKLPVEDALWNTFTKNDFILGAVVAIVVTFSHIQRRKIVK